MMSYMHVTCMTLILALKLTCIQSQCEWNTCKLNKNSNISSSAFQVRLNNTLFNHLLLKASELKFYNYTNGTTGVDRVNAQFYCKGDVNAETCQKCVQSAAMKVIDVCKYQKEGIVYSEECTLRFSNRTIFGVSDVDDYHLCYNYNDGFNENILGPHQDRFDSTMDALIQQVAFSNGTFAIKEFNISSSQMVRGFAQCSPDIAGNICYECLKTALKIWDPWANNVVFLPSCFWRYDLFGTASSSPPADTSPSGSLSVRNIVLMVIFSVVCVSVLVIGGCYLRKCCAQEREKPTPNAPDAIEEHPAQTAIVGAEGRSSHSHGLQKYTYSQLSQITNGFKRQIGKGGYGVVYRGRLDDSREVAVKVLYEKDAPKQFNNEIDVFGRISHKNLVSLLGYCEDEWKLGLVYEFMDTDLRAYMADNAGSLSWRKRLEIAIGTAEGLHYLHNHCDELIVHRDVKPDNILLTGDGEQLHAKVADFGLSKIFPAADVWTIETRVIGTHGYAAPEYFTTGLLNEKADVYSFGVVLLELITGLSPRLGINLVANFKQMFNAADIEKILDPRVPRDLNYSSVWGTTELARSCLEQDQRKRPDMWNIVVKLKQCLDMEINKNFESPISGHTSMDMMSVSSSISMTPEAR